MKDMTEDRLRATFSTIASVVRSIHLKRALVAVDPEPKLNFWRLIHASLLDVAVLDWCKLFGSDDEQRQPVHWKNMIADKQKFKDSMFSTLNIDETAWKSYWNEMKRYRDTHVAHLDFNRRAEVTHYPTLQLAVESASFYYEQVLPQWRALGRGDFPDDVRAYCTAFEEQSKMIAKVALDSTNNLQEQVY
jgi:hypothetical protein